MIIVDISPKANIMKLKISKPVWQVLGLGVIAGMRTSSAPLVVNQILAGHPSKAITNSPLKFIQSDTFGLISKLMALGELVADKLPSTGDRINSVGVIGRGISGALAGACIFKATGNSAYSGAAIGLITAAGATFASWWLRKIAGKKAQIDDKWIGAIEDLLVAGTGLAIIKI
jgi:uncharacterized membrane protein